MDILSSKAAWASSLSASAILISLLSLLSDPTVDDPLVPEIAATYVQDRQLYEQNARTYTAQFAGTSQCLEAYGVTPDMFDEVPRRLLML